MGVASVEKGVELTNDVIKLVQSRLEAVSRHSKFSTVEFLHERDCLFSREDLIQETICNLIEAVKSPKRNLHFQSKYQIVKYAVTMFAHRLSYHKRSKVHIKKSNAFTVSWDAPAYASDNMSNIVTIGDTVSTELKQQLEDHCIDMLELLRKDLYIVLQKNYNISIVQPHELFKLHKDCTILNFNTYVYDKGTMTSREMSKKYKQFGIYLGDKLFSIINNKIDEYVNTCAVYAL